MEEIQAWREVRRKRVFEHYRKIDEVTYLLPDGAEKSFEIKLDDDAICVLALTPEHDVILAEQYRPGPNAVLRELPGGGLDEGEEPLVGAARELLEETGFAGEMQFVTTSFDDAYSTMTRHVFVATDCVLTARQELSDGEFAKVVVVPMAEFRALLRSGQMTDIEVGYLGLDFLGLL